jgi:hypothetical protein
MLRKNPTEPTVELTIDGETFILLFNFEAIADAEDATGLSLIAGLNRKDVDAPRISLVRALLWACMQPRQPDTTLAEASALVNQWTWVDIWGKVLEAWVAGMKKPGPDSADPQMGQG